MSQFHPKFTKIRQHLLVQIRMKRWLESVDFLPKETQTGVPLIVWGNEK